MNKPDYKKILVFRVGHLGDTIISLPAFWSIRDEFPNAQISFLSNADPVNKDYVTSSAVLPPTGLFDETIAYENASGFLGKLGSYSKLFLKLRKKGFDAVFYLMPRLRESESIARDVKFFEKCGIKNILGAEYIAERPLTFKTPRPLPKTEKEADFLLDVLKDSGVEDSKRGCDFAFTEEEVQAADDWLSDNCPQDRPLIAVAAGTKWPSKRWPEENINEILSQLIVEYNAFPVLFGGPEDKTQGERILRKLGSGAVAAGTLNVRVGTAAMRNFALFLGNDTGTMHMAAAVGVKCVAIFAAIDFPGRWYPLGDGHHVFRVAVECEGCHTPDCFNDHLCLNQVTKESVLEACHSILSNNPTGSN